MGGPESSPPAMTRGPLVAVDELDDPRLDLYRNLNDPAARSRIDTDQSVFVVEGKLAVERLLASGYTMRSLLVDDHQLAGASDLVAATRARGVPVLVGSRALVAGTVGFALHRGVVAVANRPSPTDAERLLVDAAGSSESEGIPPLVAVLEGLNDHENIGALFRNAAAFGVKGILLDPRCADPLYRRSIRVSVGHVLHVPFARLTPWPSRAHPGAGGRIRRGRVGSAPACRQGSPFGHPRRAEDPDVWLSVNSSVWPCSSVRRGRDCRTKPCKRPTSWSPSRWRTGSTH